MRVHELMAVRHERRHRRAVSGLLADAADNIRQAVISGRTAGSWWDSNLADARRYRAQLDEMGCPLA